MSWRDYLPDLLSEEGVEQNIRETGATNVTSRDQAAAVGGSRGGTEQEQQERLESNAERLRKQVFAEQLYLIAFKEKILNAGGTSSPLSKISDHKYVRMLVDDNVGTAINALTMDPGLHKFVNAGSFDYSQLIPSIRIYKVFYRGDKEIEVQYPFNNFTDFSTFNEPQGLGLGFTDAFRGPDAGIQSISYRMEGTGRNPFSAAIVNVTTKFFFQDVKTLFKSLDTNAAAKSAGIDTFSYSDMIRYPASGGDGMRQYRIRLVLGWNASPSLSESEDQSLKDLATFAEKTKVSLMLDLHEHSLDFREDGSVALEIKFHGAMETALGTPQADMLNVSSAANIQQNAEAEAQRRVREAEALLANDAELIQKILVPSDDNLNPGLAGELTIPMGVINAIPAYNVVQGVGGAATVTRYQEVPALDISGINPADYSGADFWAVTRPSTIGDVQRSAERAAAYYEHLARTRFANQRGHFEAQKARNNAARARQIASTVETQLKAMKEKIRSDLEAAKANLSVASNSLISNEIFNYLIQLMDNSKLYYVPRDQNKLNEFSKLIIDQETTQNPTDEEIIRKRDEIRQQINSNPPTAGSANTRAPGTLFGSTPGAAIKRRVRQAVSQYFAGRSATGGVSGQLNAKTFNTQVVEKAMTQQGEEGKTFFFLLGDLMCTVLGSRGDPQNPSASDIGDRLNDLIPDYKLIFGPIPYADPLEGSMADLKLMNLYEIPVSIPLFLKFIASKIIGDRKREYKVLEFLQDLIHFVMEDCFASLVGAQNISRKNQFKLDIIPMGLDKPFISNNQEIKFSFTGNPRKPFLTWNHGVENISNCLFVHGIKTQESSVHSGLRGDLNSDQQRGIFHFLAGGPDRGILKSLKFTETKSDLYSVALMRKSANGTNHSSAIRPSRFAVKLALVGNPFFSIGQLFYVNTTLIDGGYFAKENLSFGGYYFTNAIDTYIGPDKYETEIDGTLEISDRAARAEEFMARAILTPLEYAVTTDPPPADVVERINSLTSGDQNQRNAILQDYYRDKTATRDALLSEGATVENVTGAPERAQAERLAQIANNTAAAEEAIRQMQIDQTAAALSDRETAEILELPVAEYLSSENAGAARVGRLTTAQQREEAAEKLQIGGATWNGQRFVLTDQEADES